MISNKKETPKVDIWALGIILYQLLSAGEHPFKANNPFRMIKNILDGNPDPL